MISQVRGVYFIEKRAEMEKEAILPLIFGAMAAYGALTSGKQLASGVGGVLSGRKGAWKDVVSGGLGTALSLVPMGGALKGLAGAKGMLGSGASKILSSGAGKAITGIGGKMEGLTAGIGGKALGAVGLSPTSTVGAIAAPMLGEAALTKGVGAVTGGGSAPAQPPPASFPPPPPPAPAPQMSPVQTAPMQIQAPE